MHETLRISLMGNLAEAFSNLVQQALQHYQELIAIMNSYPIFGGAMLLLYFLILTYILIGLYNIRHG